MFKVFTRLSRMVRNLRTILSDGLGFFASVWRRRWQDEKRIRSGRAWTDEIRQGLRESDLLIALLSPHAVRRKGWDPNADDQDSVCLDEIEYAIDACQLPVLVVSEKLDPVWPGNQNEL